jgi:hypothetical protein
MKRGRLLAAIAAAILIAAPAAWYFGSPWWTLWRMREAARARDLETLSTYVDRAAIQAQAERELKSLLGSVLADARNGGDFADIARRQLARPGVRGGLVDLQPWLASVPIRFAGLGGGGDARYRAYIVRHGLESFEVREEGVSLENGPALTFRRHGLGWKLTGVRWGQQ